ncbi:hypothetical protein RZS08_23810, partial [Arthrospira platensis SPKY1]|nr:hypothetical protein [Arthrospira platensis SPKY1]
MTTKILAAPLLCLALYCCLPSGLAAQEAFSRRFSFGYPGAVLTSIVATDSCYYAVGVVADSMPPFKAGNAFLRFGLDGDLQMARFLHDTTKTYETWRNALAWSADGNLASVGYTTDSLFKVMLIVYEPETG